MREGFSVPEAYSRRRAEQEIEDGLAEYKISPKSREGVHAELIEDFEQETTPEPLSRKEVELEAAAFVERHLRDLVPLMSGGGAYQTSVRSLNVLI